MNNYEQANRCYPAAFIDVPEYILNSNSYLVTLLHLFEQQPLYNLFNFSINA